MNQPSGEFSAQPGARPPARELFEDHSRTFAANRYVYPVLSRRAGGLSIGVNLSPNRQCNFRCIYCQVDRRKGAAECPVDLERLSAELDQMLGLALSGAIFDQKPFSNTPEPLRRINDIALSGDGEPTACRQFTEAVEICAHARQRHGADALKLVLITNASLLHEDRVARGLSILDANNGEIWAKLDAGTDGYFRRLSRSRVSFERIMANLRQAAQVRPIVIQSLFMRIDGQAPSQAEREAYCRRLQEIASGGGRIKLVQVYTVARRPAELSVTPLSNAEIDEMADMIRGQTGLPVAAFYGS